MRLDPNNAVARSNKAVAWNNKGSALKLLGRAKESEAAFAKAKEVGLHVLDEYMLILD